MDQPSSYGYGQNRGRELAPVAGGRGGVPEEYYPEGRGYPYYPAVDAEASGDEGFDFYKYLRILTKYRWLISGVVLACVLMAAALTLLMTPIYTASVAIQIDREAINVTNLENLQPDDGGGATNEFYQTQYELLGSRTLAERVVTTLGLADNPRFQKKRTSPLAMIKSLVWGEEDKTKTDVSQESLVRDTSERLLEILQVSPVRNSRIVKVQISHPDSEIAQKIANSYAEVFIQDNLDRRFNATSYARKFLEGRLQQLKTKLEETERQLVAYAEKNNIISLEGNKNLSTTDLEVINTKLSEARSERVKKELLWNQAQQTAGLGLKDILESKAIQENRKLRAELAAEYQQKLAIYKPAFPAMVQLRNQIKELDRQVESEVEAIKQSLEADYMAAKLQEEELLQQLEGTKTEVVDQRNRSIEYNILQREVDTNRQLYDGLLQRYKEIGVAGGVGTNNISIVDPAALPLDPSSPILPLNLALAFIAGILLGVLTALTLDYLYDSFKSPEDIERETGLPVVGVIPMPKAGSTIEEELFDARSGIAEAFRSLRTGLQFATSDGLPRTLLVTSSKPSEGKTTTTIAVAKAFAQIGLNVLLIDGDLRNASVHKRMRCGNEMGLSNYLSGAKMPEEVVQHTDTEGLILMSSGPLPPNPAELLTGPRLASLLALAAESFDIVLVDGPPIMGLADAPLLSSAVQSTMLVVAANETRRSTVKIALKRLRYARANIIGALLSKFDAKETGYGYGYGYGDYEYHSYGGKELPAPGAQ